MKNENKTRTFKVTFHTSPEIAETCCRVLVGPDAAERALNRAVEKLYGKNCWFNMQVPDQVGAGGAGQVFDGSRARTGRIGVDITEV